MYFMSDPQALHVTRNVIPGKLGVDLHLHRVHIPLVYLTFTLNISTWNKITRDKIASNMWQEYTWSVQSITFERTLI